MNVTENSLILIDSHWAVLSINKAERDRGKLVSDVKLVSKAIGNQLEINFQEQESDSDLLRRLSLSYEIAAIEGMNDFLNPLQGQKELVAQCASGAWRAFEILRLIDIPLNDIDKVHFILHLSALAYCGDRWSDLRRWYEENQSRISISIQSNTIWDRKILLCLYECWIRLYRKKCWVDLTEISDIINQLRNGQLEYEEQVLNTGSEVSDRVTAFRLIALYHWAKGTELLATYMLQGEPAGIVALIDKHFEASTSAASACGDSQLEVLLKWLHASSRQMVLGSTWWVARAVNSRVTKFVQEITHHQGMFELLPPQRAALLEKGLLDQAATAVVIDMPTSGGKTLLAQFRILQALNQFDADQGWVAYVAPTRALTAQLTRRLRRDFSPIGVRVEQLAGAVEIDTFEENMLSYKGNDNKDRSFDVLIATPEKLQLVIRNKKVPRPLALVVMDEAQNIEDESRGMRIELLLATIKRECNTANFLLLMPYVEKPELLTQWLANDLSAGRVISFGTTPWKPNDRIVGMFNSEEDNSKRAGWQLKYQTLITTPNTIHLTGIHKVGETKPLNIAKSQLTKCLKTAAMAKILSSRGTSIAIGSTIPSVWNMARHICGTVDNYVLIPDEISLVQDFLRTEISPNFELINMLSKGVGVHHAGLSDEVRTLIEWLAEEGKLRVLCATTTIAQGINFPVSSVFLSSRFVQQKGFSREMTPREFWNIAGRAGRMDHDSVGMVGLCTELDDENGTIDFVCRSTGDLVSRLVTLLTELEQAGKLQDLNSVFNGEQWDDFRCYIAHLWNEKQNLEAVLADTEQLLRNTYGYGILRGTPGGRTKADKLLEVTKSYAQTLASQPSHALLADMTGFSPEGVAKALVGMNQLEHKLSASDWNAESLFGNTKHMADLFGVMLKIPQLNKSLNELTGNGSENKYIADLTKAWVNGVSIKDIASAYFLTGTDETKAITDTCKAIYRTLTNIGTWGLSALSHLSGLDFDSLSEADKRVINALPAMIYHGVKTEEGVLMRMNNVPRSIAERLGEEFKSSVFDKDKSNSKNTREYLKNLDQSTWDRVVPESSYLSGAEFKSIWKLLSGERT